ncbi:MAG: glycosyltransferase family 4 protein [Magnetococcales bacterium]|nr:glycosyltransferase family 4 protein [Magnetococcales bacterium]
MAETAKKKKILILMPMLLIGGTEQQTLKMAQTLINAGYQVSVCCYYEVDSSMLVQFENSGALVKHLGLQRSSHSGLFADIYILLQQLIKTIKEIQPDIVHVQYVTPGFISIVATYLAGVENILATVHYSARQQGLKAKLLLRCGAFFCKGFFAVSKAVEISWFGDSAMFDPQLAKRGRKHFTIYNQVDMAVIKQGIKDSSSQKKLLRLNDNHLTIGVVGRLSREKGHMVLIRAMAEIIKQIPDIQLLLVGEGSEKESLLKKADSLNLSKNIRWLGKKEHNETVAIISLLDLLVVPSLSEGFGLVAVEAMACSTPVLASSVDGLIEIIKDGENGWLVAPGDDGELARKIVALMKDAKKRSDVGRLGHKQVEERFSLEIYQNKILTVYDTFF